MEHTDNPTFNQAHNLSKPIKPKPQQNPSKATTSDEIKMRFDGLMWNKKDNSRQIVVGMGYVLNL